MELGTIEPGEKLRLSDYHSKTLSDRSALAKRRNKTADSEPYNPRGTDQQIILNMLMMHRAAGGEGYTGLSDTAETHLDQERFARER